MGNDYDTTVSEYDSGDESGPVVSEEEQDLIEEELRAITKFTGVVSDLALGPSIYEILYIVSEFSRKWRVKRLSVLRRLVHTSVKELIEEETSYQKAGERLLSRFGNPSDVFVECKAQHVHLDNGILRRGYRRGVSTEFKDQFDAHYEIFRRVIYMITVLPLISCAGSSREYFLTVGKIVLGEDIERWTVLKTSEIRDIVVGKVEHLKESVAISLEEKLLWATA